MVDFRLFKRKQRSILDLPIHSYDKKTHLPLRIPVGENIVSSLVSIHDGESSLHIPARRLFFSSLPLLLFEQCSVEPRLMPPVVQVHLILLSSFYKLQSSISEHELPDRIKEYAEAYFIWAQSLPVIRTEQTHGVQHPADLESLPSLGILMCWHAHMLNPHAYGASCEEDLGDLRNRSYPLDQVVCVYLLLRAHLIYRNLTRGRYQPYRAAHSRPIPQTRI